MRKENQLEFEFDPKKLQLMRAIGTGVNQGELIKGLVELFLKFVRIEKEERTNDG